ncbi:MAG: hypothetical protein GX369_04305 [Euryarchaeota archaeon]|nr:hypothetical protein [Euryarchaeota archaeon]
MKIGITANSDVPEAIKVGRKVINKLENENIVLESGIARLFGREGMPIEEMNVDVLVTVGGDGTILRSLQKTSAPIFGVNAGVLGFLAEVNEDELDLGLRRLLDKQFFVEERIKLKTMLSGRRLPDATNEAVVHTAHVAKIRHFNVFVDDQLAMDVRADGIIVSTPTGSTCYAMAVGAPIVDPRVDAFIIAPMAPFKFGARPMVIPSSSRVSIRMVRPKPCLCVIDGQQEISMEGDEGISFSLAEQHARFIRFERAFYRKTREKLVCMP